ncbi:MAG: NFACT family protein [Clostridiales bacterium]|jgi:predicted ribosome quality control (RQC) complex YloA/Tae2 family protein|nr:NFACT family protein [Clostridiales bacterium]
MPNDVITLAVLTRELNELLTGGKIEKITQPDYNTIVLNVRSNAENQALLISCSPKLPRIHLTRRKKENPLNAYSFCMLLRKHLEKSAILSIELINNDRIIALKCQKKNDLYDIKTYTLIFELMARNSNIILTDDSGVILGTVRQSYLSENSGRLTLTGALYSPPANKKPRVQDAEAVSLMLRDSSNTGSLYSFLCSQISGMSKETVKEVLALSALSDAEFPLDEARLDVLISHISAFTRIYENKLPCASIKEDGMPSDFFPVEYKTVNLKFTPFALLNYAADECYFYAEYSDALSQKARALKAVLKKALTKTQKKIDDNKDALLRCGDAEQLKKAGNLILNNIYLIKKNASSIELTDYETYKNVMISLDSKLSPSDNASVYFKRYSKLKRTEENAKINLEQNLLLLEYLLSIDDSIDVCIDASQAKNGLDNNNDAKITLNEIETELSEAGLIREKAVKPTKKTKNVKKTAPAAKPYECVVDGFKIYAGRNNIQNDYVTFTLAKNSDVWLHTKGYHGAHVIISAEGRSVPDSVLLAAAAIAAGFSKARASQNVPVDYAERRYVKRIRGATKGMATYTNFKTLFVAPALI